MFLGKQLCKKSVFWVSVHHFQKQQEDLSYDKQMVRLFLRTCHWLLAFKANTALHDATVKTQCIVVESHSSDSSNLELVHLFLWVTQILE
jgi:hypothetical protein